MVLRVCWRCRCWRRAGNRWSRRRQASDGGATPARPGSPGTPSTPRAATVVAGSPVAIATATEASARRSYEDQHYETTPQPTDPWNGHFFVEGAATSFEEKVQWSELVVIVTDLEVLPGFWDTRDGKRPANPHLGGFRIYTPIRAKVKQVAKGSYTLPDIYFAAEGGTVGQDCYTVSNSRYSSGGGVLGTDYLYFATVNRYLEALPVAGDTRYRYYSGYYAYPISPSGTITIGTEHDIMGYRRMIRRARSRQTRRCARLRRWWGHLRQRRHQGDRQYARRQECHCLAARMRPWRMAWRSSESVDQGPRRMMLAVWSPGAVAIIRSRSCG